MASVLDQLPNSTLSLQGNGFNPQQNQPAWGYINDQIGDVNPSLSELHDTYSVDGNPNERIYDFNRASLGGVTQVRPPARLDELDSNAPNNTQAGLGGVVSQVYKSSPGRQYRDLGPPNGRF